MSTEIQNAKRKERERERVGKAWREQGRNGW